MKETLVRISDIIDSRRIDVAYFNNSIGIKDFVSLSQYVSVKGGKRIPKGKSFASEHTDYLYLRLSEITDFERIDYSAFKCIDEELFGILKRYEIHDNQIVFSIAGTIGKVFVLKDVPSDKRIILTENCAMIQPKNDSILPEYVSILLNCSIVQKQIGQNRIQTTIPKIGLDRIAKLKIPAIPSVSLQNKIINIYSQAQQARLEKRQEAKRLLESIDDYLLEALKIEKKQNDGFVTEPIARNISSMLGGRLDPQQFHPERIETIQNIKKGKWCRLKDVRYDVKSVSNKIPSEATYIGMENIDSCTGDYMESKEKETVASAAKFKEGDILFPKLRPYLNKVHRAQFDGYCSTEFHVFEAHDILPDFLTVVLRSSLTLAQTKHLMTGNTLPRLQTNDVEDLILPNPEISKQEEIVKHIYGLKDKAKQLQKEGDALLEEAKQKIEKMIIG